MKVLITGGTGFIGSRLALACLQKGDSVTVLGQENTPAESENKKVLEEKGAKVVLACVTEQEKISDLFTDIDLVYHLAATQHEMNIPDQRFWDVNVSGTKNILEASIRAGVSRFIHGSTIGVYGSLEGEIDEFSPCKPDNIYGLTKLEAEQTVLSYKERIPVTIIRISEAYGPGDRRLLKLFKAIQKRVFFMIGKGENIHHPIYVEDLIDGLSLAAQSEKAKGEVILLPGKESLSTSEMVAIIAEQLGTTVSKLRLPLLPVLVMATVLERTLRPLGIQPPLHRRRIDFFRKGFTLLGAKASRVLGFVPKVNFRQGSFETAGWYRERDLL